MDGTDKDNITGIEEKVLQYINKQSILKPRESVLAGVSGGADSVCLLFMLLRQREIWNGQLQIVVVHVHHMLRGQEADEDMRYVKELCQIHGVPFYGKHCPVEQIAKENGLSLEEAGRMARYQEFEKIRTELGLDKIAVAHHKDDNAETILMNLCRGSGFRGMAGMRPVEGFLVRPLLKLSRSEIEQFLAERGIAYCIDSTNLTCEYTRNKIRLELFPYLKQAVNAKATEHILQFGVFAEQVDAYFQKKAQLLFEKYGTIGENSVILCRDCLFAEELELAFLVRECISQMGVGLKDISKIHVEQVIELMFGRTGNYRQLPGGIFVEKSYEVIIFSKTDPKKALKNEQIPPKEIVIEGAKRPIKVTYGGAEFTFLRKNVKNFQTFPKNKYTKWFDYDKIKSTLQIRTRQNGDYLVINAAGGRKKLKDYWIDNKIPRQERNQKILLADGPEIIWIVGMRINEAYKITKDTKRILEVVVHWCRI